jgi:1-acyl-sn-glycerol-3-phosphate acyltransferase
MFTLMFWRLRVLLFYFIIAAVTTFCLLVLLISNLIGLSYDYKYFIARTYSYLFIWLVRTVCGIEYQVLGLEKLPKTPAVFMGNHQSFWENVFVNIIVPKHSWIIKKELFDIPVFGLGLRLMDPVAIDRTEHLSVKKILVEGQKKLNNGLWIVIFPESTRLLPHEYKKFKPSGVKLAMEAKVPITLMAHNAGLYWPKGFWIKKPGLITVEILTVLMPQDIEGQDARQVTNKAEQIINTAKDLLSAQQIS